MDLKNLLHMLKYLNLQYLYWQISILQLLLELQLILLFRSTNNVLSKIDLTNILPICGFLYGGSSNINDDGIPFNIVLESILDVKIVKATPNNIIKSTVKVDISELIAPEK